MKRRKAEKRIATFRLSGEERAWLERNGLPLAEQYRQDMKLFRAILKQYDPEEVSGLKEILEIV